MFDSEQLLNAGGLSESSWHLKIRVTVTVTVLFELLVVFRESAYGLELPQSTCMPSQLFGNSFTIYSDRSLIYTS
jgi:hypothetical protein